MNKIIKLIKRIEEMFPINNYTVDMEINFYIRTKTHIDNVVQVMSNLPKIENISREDIIKRAVMHDRSKYSEVERAPYIWLTEFHRCNNEKLFFEYPKGVKELVDKACLRHITTNRHHPQFYKNIEDMQDLDILEMVSDWTGMSIELNQNNGSAIGYADIVIKENKYKFTKEIINKIYDFINLIDKN